MITIIPKPPKKAPQWQGFLLYSSLALLAIVIIVYFVLNALEKKSSSTLQALEEEIIRVATSEDRKVESEVFASQNQIKDFSSLLSDYRKASNFFEFLEGIIHPQVWFSDFNLSPSLPVAKITGFTENFQTLAQQIYILEGQDSIEKIKLSSLSVGEGGETEFSLELSLSPEIFQK